MVTLCDLGVHINFIVGKKNIDMRTMAESVAELESKELTPISFEYYGAAEPPVRCGESHLSGLTEPPHFIY